MDINQNTLKKIDVFNPTMGEKLVSGDLQQTSETNSIKMQIDKLSVYYGKYRALTDISIDHFEDHWVVELWNRDKKRWQMADFQLNAMMREVLQIQFDTLDMPAGKFITAGEAWLMCRRKQADPEAFGILQWHGWDFIRGNVVRDLLALNHFEILPWDSWGFNQPDMEQAPPATWEEIDHIAAMIVQPDGHFEDLKAFYTQHPLYHAPFIGEYL